jgi:ABC-type sulfate/molybdate transport systems ATPase subunit
MKRLSFAGVAHRALRRADLQMEPGMNVVVSAERDALSSLLAVASGAEAPRVGRVEFGALAPVDSPAARRQIATLLAQEELPEAASVLESIGQVLSARGSARTPAQVLAAHGLEPLGTLPTRALAPRELRAVALALALTHDAAELLLLDEPFATPIAGPSVSRALEAHLQRGALVLAVSASPADALRLGGRFFALELGVLSRFADGPKAELGEGPWRELVVRASDARALAAAVLEARASSSAPLSLELGSDGSLRVRGAPLDVAVHAVISAARAREIEIERLHTGAPPLEALLAARAGLARGAYEAARAAALGASTHAAAGPPQ